MEHIDTTRGFWQHNTQMGVSVSTLVSEHTVSHMERAVPSRTHLGPCQEADVGDMERQGGAGEDIGLQLGFLF